METSCIFHLPAANRRSWLNPGFREIDGQGIGGNEKEGKTKERQAREYVSSDLGKHFIAYCKTITFGSPSHTCNNQSKLPTQKPLANRMPERPKQMVVRKRGRRLLVLGK